jgi:cell division protein FtsQ
VATVVLVGGYKLVSSQLFALGSVRVEGTRVLRADQVLAAAQVHPGEPYLTLDLAAIDRRVQALPRVASAEVRRAYPSSLRIVVVERTPVASVAAAGRYWLVSADGVVLGSATARPPGMPFVAGVPLPAGLHAGSRLPADGPLTNALQALAGLRPELARLVSGVRAASVDGLEFQLRGGTTLRYGLAELQPAKDAAALLLLGQLGRGGRRAARIDVRVPSAPTVLEGGNLHAGG